MLLALPTLAQVTPPGTTPPNAAPGQEPIRQPNPTPDKPRDWSLHFQQTLIDQWHGELSTLCAGEFNLTDRESTKLSFTSTLFIGRRLGRVQRCISTPKWPAATTSSSAMGR